MNLIAGSPPGLGISMPLALMQHISCLLLVALCACSTTPAPKPELTGDGWSVIGPEMWTIQIVRIPPTNLFGLPQPDENGPLRPGERVLLTFQDPFFKWSDRRSTTLKVTDGASNSEWVRVEIDDQGWASTIYVAKNWTSTGELVVQHPTSIDARIEMERKEEEGEPTLYLPRQGTPSSSEKP